MKQLELITDYRRIKMFGQGYTPIENLQLEDGYYECRICGVQNVEKNGYMIREVALKYLGLSENAKPNVLSFFERPTDPEKAKGWDLRMTNFFDSFGIQRGNFELGAWHGKTGTVQIVTNKKNPQYKDVYPYVDRTKATYEAPQPVQHTAQPAQNYDAAPIPDAIW
jgi:hypothetical protein